MSRLVLVITNVTDENHERAEAEAMKITEPFDLDRRIEGEPPPPLHWCQWRETGWPWDKKNPACATGSEIARKLDQVSPWGIITPDGHYTTDFRKEELQRILEHFPNNIVVAQSWPK